MDWLKAKIKKGLLMVAVSATMIAGGATAEELPAATGDILLSVTGDISYLNAEGAVTLDLALLEEIGTTEFETTTIWTEGTQSFTGVALADLLAAVGAKGTTLRASAVNDYAVDIPVSDAVDGGPIVAFLRNGEPMSLRNKGPLWIVYPYDSSDVFQSELIYSRSIWQLDRIEVLP